MYRNDQSASNTAVELIGPVSTVRRPVTFPPAVDTTPVATRKLVIVALHWDNGRRYNAVVINVLVNDKAGFRHELTYSCIKNVC